MSKFTGFTPTAEKIIDDTPVQAARTSCAHAGSEHLLLALYEGSTTVRAALERRGTTRAAMLRRLGFSDSPAPESHRVTFTPRCELIIKNAHAAAKGGKKAGSDSLITALLSDRDSAAFDLLRDMGVSAEELLQECGENITSQGETDGSYPSLKKYGADLVAMAIDGRLDPVLSREKEISRVISTLMRRRKSNPCLIGDAGVGKTAVVEGLALRIAEGNVPDVLVNKRIFSVNLTAMLSGAKYRGDFEERIKSVIEDAAADNRVILFIDEIHAVIGAGAAEGALDAASVLKPYLARGELCLIGATTSEEYRRCIEKDSALERRFQTVYVSEPDSTTAKEILTGLRARYEEHHGVKFTDEAVNAAVDLSVRYIPDRRLPDKALDLLDETAARVKLKLTKNKTQTDALKRQKEAAIDDGDFEKALLLKAKSKRQFDADNECEITHLDIAETVSKRTEIPLGEVGKAEGERLSRLEELLSERVVGQSNAVSALANAVRRGRSGLSGENRPVGVFIFAGGSGVGKTELCRALAHCLYGGERALIKLDMSEYAEKQSVSRLTGAAPGYVGYEEGGILTKKIREKPYSVVLFDEIEKAHPDIADVLLQITEDGKLTGADGKAADFTNTTVILTTNAGSKDASSTGAVGFGKEASRAKAERVTSELKRFFKPELLGRTDEVIIFDELTADHAKLIAKKYADELARRLQPKGVTLIVSDECVERLAAVGFSRESGARGIRRAVQTNLGDLVAMELLTGELTGDVVADFVCGEFALKKTAIYSVTG
ncbi:MAG: ATP-dependent Clp protease ATP-binding subunit [Oscillospiraceae bacterium]|jgi:ATP-dependent Clp protease ATP-binding subunit ClpC|nr:ATP-dependent Clp protease ATP-binding subunit [Oscillospiraceae bacterium]